MNRKTIMAALAAAVALISYASQATPDRQQARRRFDQKLVQPCVGKKAGDHVALTDRRGGEHEAICTLTAVPAPE